MKMLLIYLFTCFGIVCLAAEPAKTKPFFPATLTCFMEKIDSRSSCSTMMTEVSELDLRVRSSSGLTCGWPGRVSELHWEFLGAESGVDVYQISRRFPADAPQSVTVTKTIRFAGKRVVVFEDQYQVIVFDPAKGPAKGKGKSRTSRNVTAKKRGARTALSYPRFRRQAPSIFSAARSTQL